MTVTPPSKSSRILAWTDGSARPTNPGYGGWAFVIDDQLHSTVDVEFAWMPFGTTNNLAELVAIQRCLKRARELYQVTPRPVIISSDSQWSVNSINGDYKVRHHKELIAEIQRLMAEIQDVKVQWIQGHSGHAYNELVDKLANLVTRDTNKSYTRRFDRETFLGQGNEFLRTYSELLRTA